MKFEEILPALREGKKIRRRDWCLKYYIYFDKAHCNFFINDSENKIHTLDSHEILNKDDWEIIEEPTQKVKYYPALYKYKKDYFVTEYMFKDNESAIKYVKFLESGFYEFVRLIKEIPELIEERDEN